MILYRKTPQLRVRRSPAPEPPFWAATTIAPYGPRRATPIAIDYTALRVTAAERIEVPVCSDVRDELERMRALDGPVLIEATEQAEEVFRRGEAALVFCGEQRLDALHLASTRGVLPLSAADGAVVAIAAWPIDLDALERLFVAAHGTIWGVAVPVMFPATTDLAALDALATLAQKHGAHFFASLSVAVDATAKQALAQSLKLDDDAYAMLFHSDLDPLHIATERHIAALAASHGMADFILPPRWEVRSNWNAAVLLTLTASRMMAMDFDHDLAAALARSARVVCDLDKPILRIAEAASLSIVEALDPVSVEMLEEWLSQGRAGFAEMVAGKWRLRRDHGTGIED